MFKLTLRYLTKSRATITARYLCNQILKNDTIPEDGSKVVEHKAVIARENNLAKYFETDEPTTVLEKCEEDISHIAPHLKPTFNFAAYINKSETLQELLKLGVNFHKLEKKVGIPSFMLGLSFEKDIKNHITFLNDMGVEEIGEFITKNPLIFKENIEDLQARINYLKYKRFTDEMITRIITKNPFWLMLSTQRIDKRLGYFQSKFALTGNEVRLVAVKKPRLITYSLKSIELNIFALKEEMGFTDEETKHILLAKPEIFTKKQDRLLNTFEYLHQEMKIPIETVAKTPGILTCRKQILQERYTFLKKMNRVQFNPKEPNFVSLLDLVSNTDAHFAVEIAKSSVQTYNEFLKTL